MSDINIVSVSGQNHAPSISLFNITLVFGKQTLNDESKTGLFDLSIPWHDLPNNPSIFSLLSWHTRTSKFKGRDQEIGELMHWANDPRKISIKFVTGKGGSGKSRLAAEFAELLKKEKWAAGFADLRKSQTFRMQPEGTLLIVDYPEENQSAIKELFQDLAGLQYVNRLRVLFLTRQEISDWNDIVEESGVANHADMKPIKLTGLDATSAHEIYLSAADKTGEILDIDWKPITGDATAAWIDEAPENDLALFIVAAAINNVVNPEDPTVKYQGSDVIESLVKRELKLLRNVALGFDLKDKNLLARLLAVATIADSIPVKQLNVALTQIDLAHSLPEYFDASSELENSGLIYNHSIQALKPDIVAAVFLNLIFKKKPENAPELIWIALSKDINGGIHRLARLNYDAEVVLGFQKYGLSRWLAHAVNGHIGRSEELLQSLPLECLPLSMNEVALVALKTILPETKDNIKKRAIILNSLNTILTR